MKPKAGVGYLEAAAHFASPESSTGTNVAVSTTDDFTRGVDALVYRIDEAGGRDAHRLSAGPVRPQHHRRPDDDGLVPHARDRQQPGHGRHPVRPIDFWVPPRAIQLFDGPSRTSRTSGASSAARSGRRLHLRHDHQNLLGLRPSRSPARPTSSGSAATSSRTTSRRAIGVLTDEADDPAGRRRDEARDGRTGEGQNCSRPTSPPTTITRCSRVASSSCAFGPTPTRSPSSSTAMSAARA